ncbi:MAG: transposase [Candidatus Sulfotelmatobacter sp.]
MAKTKKQYSPEFKLKVVLEVLKGEKTATQLAGELGVHPVVLSEWKKQFIEAGPQIFVKTRRSRDTAEGKEKAELFEQIGRLKMENEWLKKKLGALT